jgi:Fe-S oxidoreductase
LVAASFAYAFFGFRSVYRVIRRGCGAAPARTDILARSWDAVRTWVLETSIWKLRRPTSVFHIAVAWGFIFYLLVNLGDILYGLFGLTFLGKGPIGDAYRLAADLASAAVIAGMVYFLLRRFVFDRTTLAYRENVMLLNSVRSGGPNRDSIIVGGFILLHVGFRLAGESFHVAQNIPDFFRPFATSVSRLWSGWSDPAVVAGEHLSWWLAIGLILLFIPYFPYTKHFHLIMSGINFLTKPDRMSIGSLDPIDFEDESVEEFGVSTLEQLPWTHLVDTYSCIMCNRCQDVCPAYTTGKQLSPSALEVNKRYYVNANLEGLAAGERSEQRLLDYAISESAVWACTSCAACVDICPVGNEPMFDILYIRRRQVLVEGVFPDKLQGAFRGMERNGNPWNLSPSDRMSWMTDLSVPTIAENPKAEVLWWVGCAPAYDPRARETARAFARILAAGGVNYAVLGDEERCTGDAARRSGNEYLFYELARSNIETLDEVAPKRIVTTCPHCQQTLGKDYGQFGARYLENCDVVHHSQFIAELLSEGNLSLVAEDGAGGTSAVTYHDPCYLGRQNGIVDEPRQVLNSLTAHLIEMPRHGTQSFCCGAGGAQMWKEEEPGFQAVNATRYHEATETGTQTVATGCPFCLTMLTDARNQDGGGPVVKDIAELVAERLV